MLTSSIGRARRPCPSGWSWQRDAVSARRLKAGRLATSRSAGTSASNVRNDAYEKLSDLKYGQGADYERALARQSAQREEEQGAAWSASKSGGGRLPTLKDKASLKIQRPTQTRVASSARSDFKDDDVFFLPDDDIDYDRESSGGSKDVFIDEEEAFMRSLSSAPAPAPAPATQARRIESERSPNTSGDPTPTSPTGFNSSPLRRNPVGVQLLSPKLHAQLFPGKPLAKPSATIVDISKRHLAANDLKPQEAAVLPEVNFDLPPLQGKTIRDHFHAIGMQVAQPYLDMSKRFAEADLPPMPATWCTDRAGWCKYLANGEVEYVDHLDAAEDLVVFDVEVLYKLSPYACMATAATPYGWYSWLSPAIFEEAPDADNLSSANTRWSADPRELRKDVPSTLIPLFAKDSTRPSIVVGHNVGYDRARVLDEYSLEKTPIRWLDTLSLHVATKGITSVQRPAWMKRRKQRTADQENRQEALDILGDLDDVSEARAVDEISVDGLDGDYIKTKARWEDITSSNSLAEVARLHCGIPVDKSVRSVFGQDYIRSATQLRPALQELLAYCASDTQTTHRVLGKVLPLFFESCPHPVSFAGALGMGNPFLPIDHTWKEYLDKADATYRRLEGGVKGVLWDLANKLKARGRSDDDPWIQQLDWSPKTARWPDADVGDLQGSSAVEASATESSEASKTATPVVEAGSDETTITSETTASVVADADAQFTPASRDLHVPESVPAWLVASARPWLLARPVGAKKGDVLPLALQVRFRGLPLLESNEYGWVVRVPVQRQEEFEKQRFHGPLELGDKQDAHLIADGVVYFRPGSKRSPKVSSPLTKRLAKEWKQGHYTSSDDELVKRLVTESQRQDEHFAISQMLVSFLQDGADSIWGKHLDWTPNPLSKCDFTFPTSQQESDRFRASPHVSALRAPKPPSKRRSSSVSKPVHGQWPKWYWDLTSKNLSPGELDLTVRKKISPLLLRMQWNGFPLFNSREHGWLYRVPMIVAATDAKVNPDHRVIFEKQLAQDDALRNDTEHLYFKVPHHAGEDANVGNPLGKTFLPLIESGVLSSAPAHGEADDGSASAAADAMNMNAQCSYWVSARERIMQQMAIDLPDIDRATTPNLGMILPQVITMGTVTRRAVEATWLTASNAKKNRVGSELKAMVRAPAGYKFVGADVDSEELWIASVMGDSQFGLHGGTAIGWMTLEGTKAAGTDVHSKTAKILNTSRNNAKIFNYSRIYGAGVKHAIQLLLQHDPKLTKEEAEKLAKNLYANTKGNKAFFSVPKTRHGKMRKDMSTHLWHGGSESFLFNTLERIATNVLPRTPALGCGVTDALRKKYLPEDGAFGSDYLPSRINWVVQSSGVDYLHMLIVAMEWLIQRYGIDARYMISVHDELRYMVKEEDAHRAALALQIANAWTRGLFCYNLGMDDLPQSVAFFSAVDVDHVLRKEVDVSCVTPSQTEPLPAGECYDIEGTLRFTGGRLTPDGQSEPIDDDSARVATSDTAPTSAPDLNSTVHQLYLAAQAADSSDKSTVMKYFQADMPAIRRRLMGDVSPIASQVQPRMPATARRLHTTALRTPVAAFTGLRRPSPSSRFFFSLADVAKLLPSQQQSSGSNSNGEDPNIQRFHARKILPYTQEQLYHLVADVPSYSTFIPFCNSSTILSSQAAQSHALDAPFEVAAELRVGFAGFNERFTSKVTGKPYELVLAEVEDSPLFNNLRTACE